VLLKHKSTGSVQMDRASLVHAASVDNHSDDAAVVHVTCDVTRRSRDTAACRAERLSSGQRQRPGVHPLTTPTSGVA